MENRSIIFIIIAVAILIVLVLFWRNMRDRKKFISPRDGEDPVSELHAEKESKRMKI